METHDKTEQIEEKSLIDCFGTIPDEKELKRRARIHQGWWRMNVLIEKPGVHPKDKENNVCNTIAEELQKMLINLDSFTIITYSDFIASAQQLDLDWEKREWTMMLWARYCATTLSDGVNERLRKNKNATQK